MKHKSYFHLIATLLIGSILSPLQASVVELTEQEDQPKAPSCVTVVQVQKGADSEDSNIKETKAPVAQKDDKEKVLEDDKEAPKVVLTSSSNPSVQMVSYEEQVERRFEEIRRIDSGKKVKNNALKWMTNWIPPKIYQDHFQDLKDLDQEGQVLVGKGPSKLKLEEAIEFKKDAIGKMTREGLVILSAVEVNTLIRLHKNSINSLNVTVQHLELFEKLLLLKNIANLNSSIFSSVETLINTVEFQMACEMYASKLRTEVSQMESSRIVQETVSKQEIVKSEPQEGTSVPSSSVVVTDGNEDIVNDTEKKPEEVKKDAAQTGEFQQ